MSFSIRTVPPSFDAERLREIDQSVDELGAAENVSIGIAVESGSRAWGFPSPDSDYDCRFIFVRREDDYLSPWPKRDVIELPLTGLLDINGWELGKTLVLLLKGNAVAIEWLMSPIIYAGDARLRDDLLAFSRAFVDPRRIANHYRRLGERQRRTYFANGKQIALKKLFYALRPAAALRWLRLHPGEAVAPMHFPTLMAECDPPSDVLKLTEELIARKATSRELGAAPLPRAIATFVDGEFERARSTLPDRFPPPSPEARQTAETLFRETIRRLGSTPAAQGTRTRA